LRRQMAIPQHDCDCMTVGVNAKARLGRVMV
jgi:hypothetical protein